MAPSKPEAEEDMFMSMSERRRALEGRLEKEQRLHKETVKQLERARETLRRISTRATVELPALTDPPRNRLQVIVGMADAELDGETAPETLTVDQVRNLITLGEDDGMMANYVLTTKQRQTLLARMEQVLNER